jgi:hypothetical protein
VHISELALAQKVTDEEASLVLDGVLAGTNTAALVAHVS